jgi:hypothetical protein
MGLENERWRGYWSLLVIFIYTGAFINWIYKYKCKVSLDSLIDDKYNLPNFVLGFIGLVSVAVVLIILSQL